MESEHYVGKVTQKAVLEHNDRILLCQGIGDTRWDLPGGRLHKDCQPMENLEREIEEELSIKIRNATPFHVCRSFHHQSSTYRVYIAYKGKVDSEAFTLDNEELSSAQWFSKEELASLDLYEDAREVLDVFYSRF